jgi:hypothetical protein
MTGRILPKRHCRRNPSSNAIGLLSIESLFELTFAATITTTNYKQLREKWLDILSQAKTWLFTFEITSSADKLSVLIFSFLRLESFSSKRYYGDKFGLHHQGLQEG